MSKRRKAPVPLSPLSVMRAGMQERHAEAARDLLLNEEADRETFGIAEPPSIADRVNAALEDDYSPMVAYSLALRAGGWTSEADRAARAAIDRAKALQKRDELTLSSDPVAVRGDISLCRTWTDLERIRPAVTLPSGLLRSLTFNGPDLRTIDLALFWTLYALNVGAGISSMSLLGLKRLFRVADHSRLSSAIMRLSRLSISMKDEPSIVRSRWIISEPAIHADLTDAGVSWEFSARFLREAKVARAGPRYAHLSLVTVRELSTPDQEHFYRAMLAAATDMGAWRGRGGRFVWQVTPAQLAVLSGLASPDVKRLKRERVMPMVQRLADLGDRVSIEKCVVGAVDRSARGQPAKHIDLTIKIAPAADIERSRSARANDDMVTLAGSIVPDVGVLLGFGGETARQKRTRRRSERERLNGGQAVAPPVVPPSARAAPDEIDVMVEALFAQLMDDMADEPAEWEQYHWLNSALPVPASAPNSAAPASQPPKMPTPAERAAAAKPLHKLAEFSRPWHEVEPILSDEEGPDDVPYLAASAGMDFSDELRTDLDEEMWAADDE